MKVVSSLGRVVILLLTAASISLVPVAFGDQPVRERDPASLAQREQPSPPIELLSTIEIAGSYPREVHGPATAGYIAFHSYAADGNHYVLHELDITSGTARTSGGFDTSITPIARSDTLIVGGLGKSLILIDWATGAVISRRVQEHGSAAIRYASLDGDLLTIIAVNPSSRESIVTRFRVPDLEVLDRTTIPFVGVYRVWRNGLVGLGEVFSENGLPHQSAVVWLDDRFQVLETATIDESAIRGSRHCDYTDPVVADTYLIYGSDCGGIRVFDLEHKKPLTARSSTEESLGFRFAAHGRRLVAIATDSPNDRLRATEYELPSLRPIRSFTVNGVSLMASGRYFCLFDRDKQRDRKKLTVLVYGLPSSEAPVTTLNASIIQSSIAARETLASTGDIYAAIDAFERTNPRLTRGDLQWISPDALEQLIDYSTWLVRTDARRGEGINLLQDLYRAIGDRPNFDALIGAVSQWMVDSNPTQSIWRVAPEVLTASLPENGSWTERYFVAGYWCGTTDTTDQKKLTPIIGSLSDALQRCDDGYIGIAINDGDDLSFRSYVPLAASDDTYQETINAITIIGDVAYAALDRRFDAYRVGVNSVDLRTARVIARSQDGAFEQVRNISGALIACMALREPNCVEMDRSTLAIVREIPKVTMPERAMPDEMFQQIIERGLGPQAATIVALSKDRVLVRGTSRVGRRELISISIDGSNSVNVMSDDELSFRAGIVSPSGQYAFLETTRPVAGQRVSRLTRIELATGRIVDLADGYFDNPLNLGTVFVLAREGALEVRDSQSGKLLCTWPGASGTAVTNGRLLGMTGHSRDVFRVIEVERLIAISRECEKRIDRAGAALDAALVALH